MLKLTYRFNNVADSSLLAQEFTKEFDTSASMYHWIKATEEEKGIEIVIINQEFDFTAMTDEELYQKFIDISGVINECGVHEKSLQAYMKCSGEIADRFSKLNRV